MPGGKMSDIRRPPRYHQERAGRTGDREKRGGGGGVGATDKNLLGADGGKEATGRQWTPGGYTGTSDGSYGMVH